MVDPYNPAIEEGHPMPRKTETPVKADLTFRKSLIPWIWTILLLVVTIIIVKAYESKGVITPYQKNEFQYLLTGIILLFALSFTRSFKDLANSLAEHVKDRFAPTPRERRFINGLDSQLNALHLAYSPRNGACAESLLHASYSIWLPRWWQQSSP